MTSYIEPHMTEGNPNKRKIIKFSKIPSNPDPGLIQVFIWAFLWHLLFKIWSDSNFLATLEWSSTEFPEKESMWMNFYTLSVRNILFLENAGLSWQLNRALITNEINVILEAVLELPAKQPSQSSPYTSKMRQMGRIGNVV